MFEILFWIIFICNCIKNYDTKQYFQINQLYNILKYETKYNLDNNLCVCGISRHINEIIHFIEQVDKNKSLKDFIDHLLHWIKYFEGQFGGIIINFKKYLLINKLNKKKFC